MSDRASFSLTFAQALGDEPPPLPGVVLDQLAQSVYVKDLSLRFVLVNQAFCRDFNVSLVELQGRDDGAIFSRALAEKLRAGDRRVLREGTSLETEEQILMASGRRESASGGRESPEARLRTLRLVRTPYYGPIGIAGVVGMFWDITDQRHLENQARKAQKMEAVAQLAGGIAHDFNNLLTGILGNLALARKELPEETPLRSLLAQAAEAGQRAADLTRQLLGFSRRIQPHPEPLDVNQHLAGALRNLVPQPGPDVDVKLELDRRLWKVKADPGQLEHVLRHLCANALEAMPQGGRFLVETTNVSLLREQPLGPEIRAAATLFQAPTHPEARSGHFVRLRVADSGQGIAPEVVSHLFEPFFSTKACGHGAGLNLAMVYGIVKEHDGWIECDSAPGQGTTFDVYLPRLQAAPTSNRPAFFARGREKILLADDQETVRCIGREILESYGYRTLTAASGDQTVEVFEQEMDVDLVLLDFTLPELELTLHRLRGLDPEVRFVLSAAYPTGPAVRAVQTYGAVGFIAKPFQPLGMARSLRAALDAGCGSRLQPVR
jgi:two-component system cell cycle sensor histidine kinase/response regulator CckA